MHTVIGIFLVYLAIRAIMRSSAKRAAERDMAARFVPRPFVFVVPNAADQALAREAARARKDAEWAARERMEAAATVSYEKEIARKHAYFMSELTRYDNPKVN